MWMGTDLVFDAFKFFIAETEHGVLQAHAYPYEPDDEHLHRRGRTNRCGGGRARRLRGRSLAPGVSDEASVAFCQGCSPTRWRAGA